MAAPIRINRAPVLTLWAAVVAERLGFDRDEALSLGRAVAGLNAQSKGRRLGVFKPHEEKPEKARGRGDGERFLVEVCGRDVPAAVTPDGVRAVTRGKAVDPAAGRGVPAGQVRGRPAGRAGRAAEARPEPLSARARGAGVPALRAVPAGGPRGGGRLGAKGVLDLDRIADLAAEARQTKAVTRPARARKARAR